MVEWSLWSLRSGGIVVARVGNDVVHKNFNRPMGGSIGNGFKLGDTEVLQGY